MYIDLKQWFSKWQHVRTTYGGVGDVINFAAQSSPQTINSEYLGLDSWVLLKFFVDSNVQPKL